MATKEELEAQLVRTKEDMQTLAQMVGGTAKSAAVGVAEQADSQLAALSDEARALVDEARREGNRMRGAAEDQIRANPLASAGIAFAAGMFIGGLLGRR